MVHYAYLFVHQYETAEDIVQECWLRLWSKPERLLSIPDTAREAYVKQCVRNACIDYKRQNHRITYSVENNELEVSMSYTAINDRIAYEYQVLAKHDLPELMNALPKQERIVVEKMFAGFSTQEISEQMHISIGTVRCYWSRARHRLYLLMQPEPP